MSSTGAVLPNPGNITLSTDGNTVVPPGTNLGSLSQVAGAAAQIAVGAGNGQTATVSTPVATAFDVVVTDQFGNPVVNGAGVRSQLLRVMAALQALQLQLMQQVQQQLGAGRWVQRLAAIH